MSKEEQIKQLERDFADASHKNHLEFYNFIRYYGKPILPYHEDIATKLYNAGYRKQEWISVDERLPKKMETVLVCIKGYLKKPIMVVSEMLEENGARWSACCGFTVTHWMPLPEAPKMKGGAE